MAPDELQPPRREGNPDTPPARLGPGVTMSRSCPGCGVLFMPAYPTQRFHSYECGTAFYRKRQAVRSKGYFNPPIPREVDVITAVEKQVTAEQAENHRLGRREVIAIDYDTCDGCGGPVLKDSGYGFSYCGSCT